MSIDRDWSQPSGWKHGISTREKQQGKHRGARETPAMGAKLLPREGHRPSGVRTAPRWVGSQRAAICSAFLGIGPRGPHSVPVPFIVPFGMCTPCKVCTAPSTRADTMQAPTGCRVSVSEGGDSRGVDRCPFMRCVSASASLGGGSNCQHGLETPATPPCGASLALATPNVRGGRR